MGKAAHRAQSSELSDCGESATAWSQDLRGTENSRFAKLRLPEGCNPSGRLCYLSSSRSTRSTSAITNRQSTATVMITRIQDDFSSKGLTSLASERLADRYCGSRADGPAFRTNLRVAALHFAGRVSSEYVPRRLRDRLPRFNHVVPDAGSAGNASEAIYGLVAKTAKYHEYAATSPAIVRSGRDQRVPKMPKMAAIKPSPSIESTG